MKTQLSTSALRAGVCAVAILLALCMAAHYQANLILLPAEAAPLRPLTADEQNKVNLFYGAGLTGDVSKTPVIMTALRDVNSHPLLLKTALRALTRLKAGQAVSSLDALTHTDPNSDVSLYAKVVQARLLAEGGSQSSLTTTVTLHRFYTLLDLTPNALNIGVSQMATLQSQHEMASPTLEVYAMREVADILYRSPTNLLASPEVRSLNFAQDFPSALKIHLVALPPAKRVQTLVQELAQARRITFQEQLKQQLLAEQGTLASQFAAEKLQEMTLHREQYAPEGFELLLGILDVTADRKQLSIAQRFRHDDNPEIANYAQAACQDILSGEVRPIVSSY